jgi:RNA polymerase sigma factor (sigma-70 family)
MDGPLMDDLSKRLADDLDGAFPELVTGLQSEVFAGLRPLAGRDAEDLTQETFIRAYRALQGYPPGRIATLRVRAWIWTIALNVGRNHLRDRRRRPTPVRLVEEPAATDGEPADLAAWRRRLGRLNEPTRKAVVLRHVIGFDYEAIAEILDRPAGTVKADVHRGLTRLRQIMETEDEH